LIAPTAIKDLAFERFGGPEFPLDVGEQWQHAAKDIIIEAVPAAHDQLEYDERGRSKYLGFVVRMGAFAIYHSGDTVVFDGLSERHALQGVDIAILPINGKVGNMNGHDAAHLAIHIGAKLVIPCHYDMFEFNTADPYAQFVPECENISQPHRVLKLGERFTYPEKP
jgi:L-ascorbate metabolism protein UlaG (beta-lactamase superfamily)